MIQPFTIESLFLPSVDTAAEQMAISKEVIYEWLGQAQIPVEDDKLSKEAVDLLAGKYVEKLRRYYQNCTESFSNLPPEEIALFLEFTSKYGKAFRKVRKWNDIDTRRIEKDFKRTLEYAAMEEFLEVHGYCTAIEGVTFLEKGPTIANQRLSYKNLICATISDRPTMLIFTISHSSPYCAHLKPKIPKLPHCRDVIIEYIIENRFHIFVDDSDLSGKAEVSLSKLKFNQPHLLAKIRRCSILRLQSIIEYEYKNQYKSKAYHRDIALQLA